MFKLIKPAHLRMREVLPSRLATDFDTVMELVQGAVPDWYEQGARERALAIVMGGWIEGKVREGEFSIPQVMRAKVAYLVQIAARSNKRDHRGDGPAATPAALGILRALYHAEVISEPSSNEVNLPATTGHTAERSMEDLAVRKRDLEERIRAALALRS